MFIMECQFWPIWLKHLYLVNLVLSFYVNLFLVWIVTNSCNRLSKTSQTEHSGTFVYGFR